MEDGAAIQTGMMIVRWVALAILLILSALFSSAETALTVVSKYKMRALAEEGNRRAKIVLKMIEKPGKMLSAILIGNNVVNLTASSIATILATELFGNRFVGIATGILTFLVLVFGEITPKRLATVYSEKLALLYAVPIRGLSIVLTPFIWLLDRVCGGIFFILRVDVDATDALTEKELRTIVDASHQDGVIESEEKDMITNIVDFGDRVAKEIMTPRADTTMVAVDAAYEDILAYFKEEQFSRLPVYEDTKENIIGILHMKDLFFDRVEGNEFEIRRILREPYYVYEYQKTSDVLRELQQESVSIAIVLNEYGEAVGMITMEDLIEEIVGEIRDEYDDYEEEVIKEVGENCYEIDGATKIDDVNEALGLALDSSDYDSIGGLVIDLLDDLPEEGEEAEAYGVKLSVLHMEKNRVERVRLTILPKEEDEEEASII